MTWHKSWLTRTPRVWRYIKHTPHNSWVAPTGQADPHRREGPPACDRQWQGLAGGDTTVTCVVASRRFKSGYFWWHMRGYGEAVRTLRRATRTWSPPDIPRARFERASRGSSRKTAGFAAVARHQRSNSRPGWHALVTTEHAPSHLGGRRHIRELRVGVPPRAAAARALRNRPDRA